MRVLEQFSKFCATVAERFATPRPQFAHDRDERAANEHRAQASDDMRPARPVQTRGDDDSRARPPYGSHPAVWPR
jgi:hypothetical protein